MASYKVEICGVNTSTLPILKESEKKDLFVRIKNGDLTAREDLHPRESPSGSQVSSGAFPLPMKMWMICFRLAALG